MKQFEFITTMRNCINIMEGITKLEDTPFNVKDRLEIAVGLLYQSIDEAVIEAELNERIVERQNERMKRLENRIKKLQEN